MYTVVAVSTIIIFVLSFFLSTLISVSYARDRSHSALLWSLGMWTFSVCVLLETFFAMGTYSQFLIKLYLVLVAVLVEFLAMGSLTHVHRKMFVYLYAAYSIAITAFLAYEMVTVGPLGNLLREGVVNGSLPTMVTVGSVLITAPGATLLIILPLISFLKEKNFRILSIILGVLVLSAGGTLYIASFPSVLYLSEFVGILLMWIGYINFRSIFPRKDSARKNAGIS